MSIPNLPDLPPLSLAILESLPPTVQTYIGGLQAVIAIAQTLITKQNGNTEHYSQLQAQQREQIVLLQQRVAELENRLKQNSQNSSKPPSSDPPRQRSPKEAKAKTGKKPGGQSGHPGHSRQLVPVEQVLSISYKL